MRVRNEKMRLSVLSLAVRGALAGMFVTPLVAVAADSLEDEVATIRRPTNYVEIGVANVSQQSAKFGEYNGLNKEGAEFIGNFSVRGGDAYQGGDGTLRWGVSGTDLGTTSRELGATVGNQGRWNVTIGHDELRHNITDTYQTPQQGGMGSNTFTLPANFGIYNGATSASATTVPPSTRYVPANALHTEDVGTTRKNTSFGASYHFSPQLSLKLDYNHLAQSGAKLMASSALGGISTGGTGTWRAEGLAVLMNPTNYKTDTYNLALNWVGDKGHLTGAYYGSRFRDGYDRMSWQNPIVTAAGNTAPAGVYQTTTMSVAPDNLLHQLNLSGGYAFSSVTKLVGGISYGRNTQNESFLTGVPENVLVPRSSLDGRVITKHADLKLTTQATKSVTLTAAMKHNERDNRSPSNIYQYYAINNVTAIDAAANAPYSHKKTALELAADFKIGKGQNLRLAYDHEKTSRWCNNYALVASNCLLSPSSKENKLSLKYKLKANDAVNVHAGYAYSERKSKFDNNAITPLAGLDTLTPDDVNSQNYPGFAALPYASRKQDLFKAGVNWQATEKLDLGVEARYAKDKYIESTLGVRDSDSIGINLDATYTYSEDASISAYVSWQDAERNMRIGASGAGAVNAAANYGLLVAPTNVWTNRLAEDGHLFGINTKHRLMGGKLELTGDLSYSYDKSGYSTQVPYLATCGDANVLSCGVLPDIKSKVTSLKIAGIYSLDKTSKIAIGYLYQKLKSDDYQYNWFQLGSTGTRGMPTNQQAPNYSVNVLAVSYIYNFK